MCSVKDMCGEVEGVQGGLEGMLFCWVFCLCVLPLIFFVWGFGLTTFFKIVINTLCIQEVMISHPGKIFLAI